MYMVYYYFIILIPTHFETILHLLHLYLQVATDNINEAFLKVKGMIASIFSTQVHLSPMFDIDFANQKYYPNVEKRLDSICNEIAPQRLFY